MAIGDLVIPFDYGYSVIKWLRDGTTAPYTTTIGFKRTDSVSTASDIAQDTHDICELSGSIGDAGQMLNQWTFAGVDSYLMTSSGLSGGSSSGVEAGTRGAATDPALVSTSVIVKKTTALVGRQHRGRMYLPPFILAESDYDSFGVYTLVMNGFLTAMVDAFSTGIRTGSTIQDPYILHRVPKVGTAPDPDLITGFQVETRIATQRRRLRR